MGGNIWIDDNGQIHREYAKQTPDRTSNNDSSSNSGCAWGFFWFILLPGIVGVGWGMVESGNSSELGTLLIVVPIIIFIVGVYRFFKSA